MPEDLTELAQRTQAFMKKFAFRSIHLTQPSDQIKILEANASIVAFSRTGTNNCMLATRASDIANLMQKLVPNSKGQSPRSHSRRGRRGRSRSEQIDHK